jgi:Protein kinase domain/Sulfatase-modifying factor enzyme 1
MECLTVGELARRRDEPEVAEHIRDCAKCSALVNTRSYSVQRTESVSSGSSLPTVPYEAYKLRYEIARGGMGRIFSADDVRVGRTVAIKLASGASLTERFEHEARITARLQHPSIIPIYEVARWPDGSPFYAMREVPGRTLRDVFSTVREPGKRRELLSAIVTAADAVAFAHEHRVIHRDLKPSNILIGVHGETVVIDWGLAKELGSDEPTEPTYLTDPGLPPTPRATELTAAGAIVGTPRYMSPEQARGESVDERTDVYALGALLFEMITGHAPYAGSDDPGSLVSTSEPPGFERLTETAPAALVSIVRRCMNRNRNNRYRTARELVEDLRRFRADGLVEAHAYDRRQLARRWAHEHRTWIASISALFALFVVIVTSRASGKRAHDTDPAGLNHAWNRGHVHLVLAPFDVDPSSLTAIPVRASDLPALSWTLHEVDRKNGEEIGHALGPGQVVRHEKTISSDALEVGEDIDVRGGDVFLEVVHRGRNGEECSPAEIFIRDVPGFGDDIMNVRVPVPTCDASRLGMNEIPAGPTGPGAAVEPRFRLAKTEVSNREFALLEGTSVYTEIRHEPYPPDTSDRAMSTPLRPVTGVTYTTARRFCRMMGKDLPTYEQWRRALLGAPKAGTPWPPLYASPTAWSNLPPGQSGASNVGTNPADESPFGIFDLVTNVREWIRRPDGLASTMGLGWNDPAAGGQGDPYGGSHWNGNTALMVRAPTFQDFQTGIRCADASSDGLVTVETHELEAPRRPKIDPSMAVPATIGAVDVTSEWKSDFEREVKNRRDALLVRGNRPTTSLGHCAVEMFGRTPTDNALTREAFASRNGSAWTLEDDEFDGTLKSVAASDVRPGHSGSIPEAPAISQQQATELAATFAAKNFDVFGLDKGDVMETPVLVTTGPPGPASALRTEYDFSLRGTRPEARFRQFPSMNRSWILSIAIRSDGKLLRAMGRNDEFSDLQICDTPRINREAATSSVLNQPLARSGMTAVENLGVVTARDIDSATLTLYRSNLHDPARVVVRLAYAVVVKKDGLSSTGQRYTGA